MTEADLRVATLAALFAPSSAAALLGRFGASAPSAVAHASRLAGAPRRVRLDALAAALLADLAACHAAAEAAARLERPRVAAVLLALAPGAPTPEVAPALLRLCRERLVR
jgi:hypothetical protein